MQTHLKGFGLENFRVFKDYTWFDFAPITILTGPNSSGKSSLNKALMLMKDNFKSNRRGLLPFYNYPLTDNFLIDFDGADHNLGSALNAINGRGNNPYLSFYFGNDAFPIDCPMLVKFAQFVGQGTNNRITKSAGEANNLSILMSDGKKLICLFSLSYEERSFYCDLPSICRVVENILYNINEGLDKTSDGFKDYLFDVSDQPEEFILKTRRTLERFISKFSSLDWKHRDVDMKDFFDSRDPFYSTEEHVFFDKSTDDFEFYHRPMNLDEFLSSSYNMRDLFGFLMQKNGYLSSTKSIGHDFFPEEVGVALSCFCDTIRIILGTFEDNDKHGKDVTARLPYLNDISYLPSIKGFNERSYRSRDEHVLNLLFKKYQYNYILADDGARKSFYNKWTDLFGLGKLLLERDERLDANFFTVNGLSSVDVGYGLTQIIAVILKIVSIAKQKGDTAYSEWFENTILILEEPEANLHPKYQSLLADMYVDAAETFHIQFIIETHSEYLIRKMQYLTAKKQIKTDDTVIYYFHDPNNVPADEKQVKKIQILEDGSLSDDFGSGFFDEAANWELELIRLKNAKNRNN